MRISIFLLLPSFMHSYWYICTNSTLPSYCRLQMVLNFTRKEWKCETSLEIYHISWKITYPQIFLHYPHILLLLGKKPFFLSITHVILSCNIFYQNAYWNYWASLLVVFYPHFCTFVDYFSIIWTYPHIQDMTNFIILEFHSTVISQTWVILIFIQNFEKCQKCNVRFDLSLSIYYCFW